MISCAKTQKLYEKCKKKPNNIVLKEKYKNYSKILGKILKKSKK